MNVLANDGISQEGVEKLTAAGFNTILESVDQANIIDFINENNIEVLLCYCRQRQKCHLSLIRIVQKEMITLSILIFLAFSSHIY